MARFPVRLPVQECLAAAFRAAAFLAAAFLAAAFRAAAFRAAAYRGAAYPVVGLAACPGGEYPGAVRAVVGWC